ncbi:MAG: hypothetical protein C3F02_02200 [Parcubacteria group bacterium]|nr:MAG: hypothetical protein C3F02_02200 [Parcubacteria group bacterium]
MHQFSLEKFEGPLDLLLSLIEKDKLQITQISLAQVTDQYLSYIEKSENLPSAEVADFLLIASKLIYIKSKYLLPNLDLTDEDDAGSLERQLKIYKQYYEASKVVNRLYNSKKRYALVRNVPYRRVAAKEFLPPIHITAGILAQVFQEILYRIERVMQMPKAVMNRVISISEKIKNLRDLIKEKVSLNFSQMIKNSNDKVEVVVSFLAMLELIKQREIVVQQSEMFGELNIKKL